MTDHQPTGLTKEHWRTTDMLLSVPNILPIARELIAMGDAIQSDCLDRKIAFADHPIVIMLVDQMHQITKFGAGSMDACAEIRRQLEDNSDESHIPNN